LSFGGSSPAAYQAGGAEADIYCLWTRTAAVTGGAGNSNALVGTPETVAQAILDYVDLGVGIISMRGYDLLQDAIDVGQQVIPLVREEVAKRDADAGIT
jgi:alkanesulfonate monooxygenase